MLLAAFLLANGTTDPPALDAVRARLLRRDTGSPLGEAALVRELVALGETATPALFELVSGRELEALLGDAPAAAWACDPERIDDLALAALGELPPAAVRAHLAACSGNSPPREVRAAALAVLARQARPEGLPLFLSLCAESGIELEQRALREPARAALANMLTRDARSLSMLERGLSGARPELKRLACEALANWGAPEAVPTLASLLGLDPSVDQAALLALIALGKRRPWDLAEPVARHLRPRLRERDVALCALAGRGLGELRHAAAVPDLITALADAEPQLEYTLLWSLREITGETRARTTREWAEWLQREQAWWSTRGTALLADLATAPPETFSARVRELVRHPIGRERAGVALAAALDTLAPDALIVACDALAQLGACNAVPRLVGLLREEDERLREAAARALRGLTGLDLPARAEDWEASVPG
jgi:HEAT repeat protein